MRVLRREGFDETILELFLDFDDGGALKDLV